MTDTIGQAKLKNISELNNGSIYNTIDFLGNWNSVRVK